VELTLKNGIERHDQVTACNALNPNSFSASTTNALQFCWYITLFSESKMRTLPLSKTSDPLHKRSYSVVCRRKLIPISLRTGN